MELTDMQADELLGIAREMQAFLREWAPVLEVLTADGPLAWKIRKARRKQVG